MIYNIDGTFLPDSVIDCYNENTLDPFIKHGNCQDCVIQKFTKRYVIYLQGQDVLRKNNQLEIVDMESCPWFRMLSERNRVLLENDELKKKLMNIHMLTSTKMNDIDRWISRQMNK